MRKGGLNAGVQQKEINASLLFMTKAGLEDRAC